MKNEMGIGPVNKTQMIRKYLSTQLYTKKAEEMTVAFTRILSRMNGKLVKRYYH